SGTSVSEIGGSCCPSRMSANISSSLSSLKSRPTVQTSARASAMALACSLRSHIAIVARVELRQLAAFLAVADELHFGRAADRIGIVQPAVSQLVRRLERELGIVLFERSSHHVVLTAAGTELLPIARQALAARDELANRAAALAR